jgi:hypothetical protein
MGKTDLRIWKKRLGMQPLVSAEEYYDVRVGWGAHPGVGLGDDDEQPWLRLVSKRIDVVIETESHYEIWEVKSLSSMAMLGQLLTYKSLFIERYSPSKPVSLWGCCENVDEDVWPLLSASGVSLFVVGEPDEPPGLFPRILAAGQS